MEKKEWLECISFFNELSIDIEDVTTEEEKNEKRKVVIANYHYKGKTYTTKKLYYQQIDAQKAVFEPKKIQAYFEEEVYWLDIDKHQWPHGSGAEIEKTVIEDMYEGSNKESFDFFCKIANNQKNGYLQKMTMEGRRQQYGFNFTNNNHWHDLIFFVKEVIKSRGENPISKKFYAPLVFEWKKENKGRKSLAPYFGSRAIVKNLFKNIKKISIVFRLNDIIPLLKAKKQIILQGPPGTGKTYLAKQLANVLTEEEQQQQKLVQFHPSYTYEDFVRGISAASNAEGELVYEARNKILAKFAEKAIENIQDTQKDIQELSEEERIEELLLQYAEDIANQLAEKGPHRITDAVSIVEVEEDAFRYTGSTWKNSSRMKFNDLILAQRQKATTRQEFLKIDGISGLARQHASYFIKVLNQFQAKFEQELAKPIEKEAKKPQDKAYVLIIDEINRANLPSVLGELIYALEYRGEAVESMYAVDGDNQITLPENLYIIGTMNTADRSVGHIDYAIKRRFAFVEILPNAEVITHSKAKELFNQVAALFVQEGENGKENSEYLAPDFRYQDVQLGHSYFILENGTDEELKMRLEYEILPILSEYLKDGVLLESAADYINQKIKGFV